MAPIAPDRAISAQIEPSRPTTAAPTKDPNVAPDELLGEEREQNPASETVRLKLFVSPPVRATVLWGRKKLGEARAGAQLVEIERPRGSGPLDLLVTADGFLPHHVRLFTDRDDKLSIRLLRPHDAVSLLGYRRGQPKSSSNAETAPPAMAQ